MLEKTLRLPGGIGPREALDFEQPILFDTVLAYSDPPLVANALTDDVGLVVANITHLNAPLSMQVTHTLRKNIYHLPALVKGLKRL